MVMARSVVVTALWVTPGILPKKIVPQKIPYSPKHVACFVFGVLVGAAEVANGVVTVAV